MMQHKSPLPHQSRPISARPLLSRRPCQYTGTIQFISSNLCQRICCCLQRAALKHLGSSGFTRRICQLLEAPQHARGGALCFLSGGPIPTWTSAAAHTRGTKACPLPGLLLHLRPGALKGRCVKELVIEINEGKPPSYCPQRLFLAELF